MKKNLNYAKSSLISVLGIKVSCGITGFESPAKEYLDLPLKLDNLLIDQASSTFLARVSGHSMTGFGIFSGDLLIIDRNAPVSNTDIVAATLNGEFICKMLDRKNRQLKSKNIYNYQSTESVWTLTEKDEFTEEGIIVSSIRLHRTPRELSACMP